VKLRMIAIVPTDDVTVVFKELPEILLPDGRPIADYFENAFIELGSAP